MGPHIIAIAIGLILDRIIGDPPSWPHPVRLIGKLIIETDTWLNKGRARKAKGVVTRYYSRWNNILRHN